MRVFLYIFILSLLFFAPVQRVDVSKLLPIEAVAVYQSEEGVVLETDTKHRGVGATVTEALENLKNNTPAVVYLDTAEFLLISEESIPHIEQLGAYLKPAVKVAVCDAKGVVKETAKYLEVHGDLPRLDEWSLAEK